MARVTGPLFSMDASGTIGKTVTFSKWKGRNYTRQRVIPSNPRSAAQTGPRSMFKYLTQIWASIGVVAQATWDTLAESNQISPFNAFVGSNLQRFQMNQAPSHATPAAEAATALTVSAMTLTGGVGHIQVDLTPSGATAIGGFVVLRDSSAITSMNWSKVVAVIPADGANAVNFTDSPLAPGTYHYRAAVFTTDGVLGALITDDSADAS